MRGDFGTSPIRRDRPTAVHRQLQGGLYANRSLLRRVTVQGWQSHRAGVIRDPGDDCLKRATARTGSPRLPQPLQSSITVVWHRGALSPAQSAGISRIPYEMREEMVGLPGGQRLGPVTAHRLDPILPRVFPRVFFKRGRRSDPLPGAAASRSGAGGGARQRELRPWPDDAATCFQYHGYIADQRRSVPGYPVVAR